MGISLPFKIYTILTKRKILNRIVLDFSGSHQ